MKTSRNNDNIIAHHPQLEDQELGPALKPIIWTSQVLLMPMSHKVVPRYFVEFLVMVASIRAGGLIADCKLNLLLIGTMDYPIPSWRTRGVPIQLLFRLQTSQSVIGIWLEYALSYVGVHQAFSLYSQLDLFF